MRRFTFYAPDYPEMFRPAWVDAGFKPVDPEVEAWPEQGPDVLLLHHNGDKVIPDIDTVKKLLPRLYMVTGDSTFQLDDKELAGIFEQGRLIGDGLFFNFGTRLPGQPAVPLWEAYRFNGNLPPEAQVKAVADSVYRFLLEDQFRETAEWCGHMSSVVGPA